MIGWNLSDRLSACFPETRADDGAAGGGGLDNSAAPPDSTISPPMPKARVPGRPGNTAPAAANAAPATTRKRGLKAIWSRVFVTSSDPDG